MILSNSPIVIFLFAPMVIAFLLLEHLIPNLENEMEWHVEKSLFSGGYGIVVFVGYLALMNLNICEFVKKTATILLVFYIGIMLHYGRLRESSEWIYFFMGAALGFMTVMTVSDFQGFESVVKVFLFTDAGSSVCCLLR